MSKWKKAALRLGRTLLIFCASTKVCSNFTSAHTMCADIIREDAETDHSNLHIPPTPLLAAFITSFILASLSPCCFPSQHFNLKSKLPLMRKIKAALHQAQVTNSILVIMAHGDIIDFSEINLVNCCYPLLHQREARREDRRRRRRRKFQRVM